VQEGTRLSFVSLILWWDRLNFPFRFRSVDHHNKITTSNNSTTFASTPLSQFKSVYFRVCFKLLAIRHYAYLPFLNLRAALLVMKPFASTRSTRC